MLSMYVILLYTGTAQALGLPQVRVTQFFILSWSKTWKKQFISSTACIGVLQRWFDFKTNNKRRPIRKIFLAIFTSSIEWVMSPTNYWWIWYIFQLNWGISTEFEIKYIQIYITQNIGSKEKRVAMRKVNIDALKA